MVEHSVAIDHTFEASSGAAVVIHIDQATQTINIACQFARGRGFIKLTPAELHKLVEIFDALAVDHSPSAELSDLFRQAAKMVNH